MKKQNKEYLLNLLMNGSSLHELLGILQLICENLELTYLNPRIKHFRYFQLTFFGLMVKVRGLLEIMILKAEFLSRTNPEFVDIHEELGYFHKEIQSAYNMIHTNQMVEGKTKIIECSKKYHEIFENLTKTVKRLI